MGKKREQAKYAFAIFEGIVREVYEISGWFPAGATLNSRNLSGFNSEARWEFVGRRAPEDLREKYRNGDVSHLFPSGAQNPIKYLNTDS